MVRAKNLLNPFKKLEPLATKSLRKLMKRVIVEDEDEDEALGWWRFLNYGYDETWKEESIRN